MTSAYSNDPQVDPFKGGNPRRFPFRTHVCPSASGHLSQGGTHLCQLNWEWWTEKGKSRQETNFPVEY